MQTTNTISTVWVYGSPVLTVVVAVISAWLTAKFSFRRFRTERAWDRRVAAYERIIQCLHHLKSAWRELLDAENRGRNLPERLEEQFNSEFEEVSREVDRAIDLGTFLLSEKALVRLKRYRQELREARDPGSYHLHLLQGLQAVQSCLEDFVDIARKDLNIPTS